MSNDQQQIARAAKIKELLGDPLNQTWDPLFVILENVHAKFDQLPPPLLWIEPSVNMPHLQACLSYVLGAPLGSILITGVLLEHVLRMAVIDRVLGYQGGLDETHWQKYKWYNVGNFLDGGPRSAPDDNLLKIVASIIAVEDQQWWRDAAKQIRDKATHFDAPEMIAISAAANNTWGFTQLATQSPRTRYARAKPGGLSSIGKMNLSPRLS